jgi:hypothetical protein
LIGFGRGGATARAKSETAGTADAVTEVDSCAAMRTMIHLFRRRLCCELFGFLCCKLKAAAGTTVGVSRDFVAAVGTFQGEGCAAGRALQVRGFKRGATIGTAFAAAVRTDDFVFRHGLLAMRAQLDRFAGLNQACAAVGTGDIERSDVVAAVRTA